ncbi:MAG: aldehyde dehydrogenase [Elusimicrobia bacterium]|nr:aldehyde dehydrogenase [Elusimicrobiota bacterium]
MKSMWINGEWVAGKAGTLKVVNPATEEVIDEVPDATRSQVSQAVEAARAAFSLWSKTMAHEKAELMHEAARKIRDKSNHLATLLTLEGGKPLRENLDEMSWSASCFDYYAELQRNRRGRVIPSLEPSQLNLVLKEPYGVVGCIIPWNYPVLLLAWKAAPALAAGNTVVIKPAEQTPLSTLALAEVFEHFPPGVVNIVTGSGETAGQSLVEHPGVGMVAFTGSLETGRRVARICADQVKKVHLELGGKDAFVVEADADLDVAAKAVAWAAFLNAGQVCTSAERIYVHKGVARPFIERLVEFTKKLKVGDGMQKDTDIGPMIGRMSLKKVEAHVKNALAKGAKLLTGGKRPKELSRGFFFEPTILSNVDHSMTVMRDETFGPVCPVRAFNDFDEAVRWTNESVYGLGANLYTHDAKKVKQFYEEVQAGTIWVNDPLTDNDAGPFGGYKATGGGRELGEEGLEEFQQSKHVHWDFEQNVKPWWYPYGKKG